jgi:phosphopantothenate-cysteine ligase
MSHANDPSFPTPGLIPNAREFSTEDYFNTQRPPANLAEKTGRMQEFVNKWAGVGDKKVVLVTVSRG